MAYSRRGGQAAFALEPIAEHPDPSSFTPWAGRDVRREVCTQLRGQPLFIPDLQSFFTGWHNGTNSHIEQLRGDIHTFLSFTAPSMPDTMASDAVNFTAQCWPESQYDELRIATIFAVWIYHIILAAWEGTPEIRALDKAARFRVFQEHATSTTSWCRQCLGLNRGPLISPPVDPVIRMFEIIANAFNQRSSPEQREHLQSQLDFFFRMMEFERRVELSGSLPDVNDYRQCRMGTSAINILLCIIEFSNRMQLPQRMVVNTSMERLWAATNVICATTTDILQIRKRVADQQVDNLVIFLFVKLGNVQAAVNTATDQVKWAVDLFVSASKRLLQEYAHDPDLPKLQTVIRACEYACTANFNFSLFSPHHMLGLSTLQNGAHVVI